MPKFVHVRFWWGGYSPEDALTSFDPIVLDTPFEGSADDGETWLHPRDGTTLQTIQEWILDHDCTVVDTELVGERHNGRWEGLYVLTIGKRR